MLKMQDNLTQDRTEEIKRELFELQNTLKMSVQKAIRIGELLTEQKAFVGHGQFLPWLEKNFEMTERTAQRYMNLFAYRDKTDTLSDLQSAYRQIETIEAQEKQSKEERDRSIISEYRKTGIKPPGWTPKIDKAVKDTDAHLVKVKEDRAKEDAEREQRAKEYREKQEAATRPYVAPASPMPEPPDDTAHYYRLGKLTEEMLNNASSATTTHTNQRTEWKEKIRLSDGGQEDAFMDALIDYLETLADDNRRLEACNNIVKICRNIAVELQKKSAIAA